jgi:hypothetical protein
MSNVLTTATQSGDMFDTAAANRLYRSIRDTARSRFVAARRLSDRDFKIVRISSFASGFLIINSILPYFLDRAEEKSDVLNLASVGLALTILISTLLQFSRVDSVSAEQHHRSGLELNELSRQMDGFSPHISNQQYKRFADKYNAILQKYSINHDPIDYRAVITERAHENPWLTKRTMLWYNLQLLAKGRVPDLVLALVFAVGGATAISFVLSENPASTKPPVCNPVSRNDC